MENIFCAWWNLENLFDEENAAGRSDKLKRTIGKELKGWTKEILDLKLNQLASIINKMNNNQGPDIIGVAEVENKNVLTLLKNKLNRTTYDIIHADSPDERGIDVAFIYDSNVFTAGKTFYHVIMKRTATRDIVQVNMKHKPTGKDIVFIGNHWPSRSNGKYESEPYRMMAGETLAYFHERIYQELNEQVPIIVMGDFNDDPYDRSIMEYALAINTKEKIVHAKSVKYFFNLMWDILSRGDGSYYFDGFDVLDQFMVSGNIIKDKCFVKVQQSDCSIQKFPEMTKDEKPIKFGRPTNKEGYNKNGYSDHFPIAMNLTVK